MSAKTQFFSHDFNARNNYKLLELRCEYGWEGYGLFWAICETIAENDKPLPLDRIGALSIALGVSREFLAGFFKFCIDLGIFIEKEAGITSESLEDRLEYKRKKSRKASENAKKRWNKAEPKQEQSELDANAMQSHNFSNANNTTQHNTTQNIDIEDESSKTPQPKKSKSKTLKETFEDRKQAFSDEVNSYHEEYEQWMLDDFFGYWSEPNQSKTKMNKELKKTWDTSRRLQTWAKNQRKDDSPYKSIDPVKNNSLKNERENRIKKLKWAIDNPEEARSKGANIEACKIELKVLEGK